MMRPTADFALGESELGLQYKHSYFFPSASAHELLVVHTAMRYHADTEMLEVEGAGYVSQDFLKKIREDRADDFLW